VPDYRPATDGTDPDASADIAAAVAYLRGEAAGLGVDASRLAILAFSAGGPFAIRAAYDPAMGPVAALALFYSPLDGFARRPGLGVDYRLLPQLSRVPDLPVLLAFGRREGIAEGVASLGAVAAAAPPGAVTMLEHPTAGHGFEVTAPGPDTDRIVAATADFLAGHLGR
jgi:dienelactone hydrolase